MKKANYIKIAGLALFVWGCKKEYVSSDIQLTSNLKPVRVVSLQEIQTTNPITASGVLASKEETVLSFKVGGVIQNLNVNEGEQVHTNQKLANLNLSEINAQVESAK